MNNDSFCEPLLTYMRGNVELDLQATNAIISQSKEVLLPKGHLLLQGGNVSKYCYFIVSGQARSYYIDSSGKTTTWLFHFNEPFSNAKNLFINDYRSFLTNTPGTLTIETLTEVKAILWNRYTFDYLYKHLPVFEEWMRKMNEKFFIVIYDRVFTLLTMSAPDRYAKMLRDEPHLMQMFSNFYLASYLNIAPQSLSRIKGKL